MRLSSFWGKSLLGNRYILWSLFIVNLLGTIYGYIWYDDQLRETWATQPHWLIVFVPDSPTASLFFTLALLFLLFPHRLGKFYIVRTIIEGLAVVTSVKYGLWAVAIIFAGAAQGEPLVWQHWMLVGSHLAMVVEALLYVRLFKFGTFMLVGAWSWTLLNDMIDYSFGVYPWLPEVLWNDVNIVMVFTFALTCASALAGWAALRGAKRR
ncbi:DUF1405 domain-containing protein [Paenibacillus aceti]|uniref:DUF1405 domain-containing protein n=1 Tax=Paenibacillus aceti TaxID=1820010 RepID=A0ABQ1VY22_9BACL|nr:DUF1405 domain-containing protein [Paenibacillus aceti]GGG05160.1 hypothetical protein GCM10010913_28740 [Paenibacillus aceti]